MDLFEFKVTNLKSIKRNTEQLIKECHKLLRKIEMNGVDSSLSIDTEIGRYADDIRKRMTVLGYINTFGLDINNKGEE
jgi:hypothetical protein